MFTIDWSFLTTLTVRLKMSSEIAVSKTCCFQEGKLCWNIKKTTAATISTANNCKNINSIIVRLGPVTTITSIICAFSRSSFSYWMTVTNSSHSFELWSSYNLYDYGEYGKQSPGLLSTDESQWPVGTLLVGRKWCIDQSSPTEMVISTCSQRAVRDYMAHEIIHPAVTTPTFH